MSAASPERKPKVVFASAPMLLGMAFMMGVVLAVVFPSGREFAELTGKHRVDAYSIAYLSVLTRANRDDGNLRLVYARQLATIGRWDEALAALDATFDTGRLAEVESLRLELTLARAYALPDGDVARSSALAAVHEGLRGSSAGAWPAPRARAFGKLALELEDPALAARYFLVAAEGEASSSARAEAMAEAGSWLRAGGDVHAASECFRRAAETTDDVERKTAYASARADALEAEDRPCDAAAAVRTFATTSTDRALVARATALATSCGDARHAKELGRHLLEISPRDEAGVRAQVGRELAAGDPPGALVLLEQLVKMRPNDGGLRLSTARVAEWSGQPQVALEHWLFLVSTGRFSERPVNVRQ